MFFANRQRTLARSVTCKGMGVHSGREVKLTLNPAPPNFGIRFLRTDLPGTNPISALFHLVVDTSMATVIGSEGVIVSTIEHLMACFAGMGVDNALVELDNYEMPIMDGSAAVFSEMVSNVGLTVQDAVRQYFVVKKPIEIEADGKFTGIYPADGFKITCMIEFDNPVIGLQDFTVDVSKGEFEEKISRARTFGFLHELEFLKMHGLAKGATLETGIAINGNEIMNPEGLRYADEFVRHKILDCIGDFSLIGMPITGHVVTKKSGHMFNNAFIRTFFQNKDAWETCSFEEIKGGSLE